MVFETIYFPFSGTYLRIYRHLWIVDNGRGVLGRGLEAHWTNFIVNKFGNINNTTKKSKRSNPAARMGGALSHLFQSGQALIGSSHNRAVSEQTKRNIRIVFDALCANPKVPVQRLEGLLSSIPRSENILQVHNEEGYNLLQKCVGLNHIEMIRWCLCRNIDINRGACSLPLHIACLKGYSSSLS